MRMSTTTRRAPIPGPGGIVGTNARPYALPGIHSAAALGFFLLGTLGLVGVAPDLAQRLPPRPRVAGVTHLVSLGWLTASILGALCQFLPVALGVPISSERWAHIS